MVSLYLMKTPQVLQVSQTLQLGWVLELGFMTNTEGILVTGQFYTLKKWGRPSEVITTCYVYLCFSLLPSVYVPSVPVHLDAAIGVSSGSNEPSTVALF